MAESQCRDCIHWQQITVSPEYGSCRAPAPAWVGRSPDTSRVTAYYEGAGCAMFFASRWRKEVE